MNNDAQPTTCFFVSPIGGPTSAARRRTNDVLSRVLIPALEGVVVDTVVRSDMVPSPGFVTTTIIGQILDSTLVVADITGLNANVFYELAIAHAAQKPVVVIRDPEIEPPFDIAALRAIDCSLDRGTISRSRNEVREVALRLVGNPSLVESPVTVALFTLGWTPLANDQVKFQSTLLGRIDTLESRLADEVTLAVYGDEREGETEPQLQSTFFAEYLHERIASGAYDTCPAEWLIDEHAQSSGTALFKARSRLNELLYPDGRRGREILALRRRIAELEAEISSWPGGSFYSPSPSE